MGKYASMVKGLAGDLKKEVNKVVEDAVVEIVTLTVGSIKGEVAVAMKEVKTEITDSLSGITADLSGELKIVTNDVSPGVGKEADADDSDDVEGDVETEAADFYKSLSDGKKTGTNG